MRFNRLDLNLLIALDALLREKNVSRAAERMHLSQSAMSNALSRLREYFDDQLLVLVGRRLELTPRAEMLQDSVRDVLVRIDATIATQPEFVPAESTRVFQLLVSEFTSIVLMPMVLELAWRETRTVGFDLMPQTIEPEKLLNRGAADLLIMPSDYMSPDHPTEALFEENYVCVVWEGNRRIGDTLSFDDYLESGHVAVQLGPDKLPAFEGWFLKRYGIARRIEVTTSNMQIPCSLVVGTDRIATVHARLARQAAKMLPIRLLPPPIDIQPLTQAMQWHKHKENDPGMRWLRDLLLRASRAIAP